MSKELKPLRQDSDKIKCNICGLPGKITYREADKETGEIKTKTHEVPCLGHLMVHPSMWNKHPDYDKYRKYAVRQQKRSEKANANRKG